MRACLEAAGQGIGWNAGSIDGELRGIHKLQLYHYESGWLLDSVPNVPKGTRGGWFHALVVLLGEGRRRAYPLELRC